MILLEVENRGVLEALTNHFKSGREKGKFDHVNARIADFDGCIYHLYSPDGSNRDRLELALEIAFFDQLEKHGATEKLKEVYGQFLQSVGKRIVLAFPLSAIPENYEQLARDASRLKRNCFAAVFEKYFQAQVALHEINTKKVNKFSFRPAGVKFNAPLFISERAKASTSRQSPIALP